MTFKDNAKTALAKVLSDLIQSDGIVNQGEINYLRKVFKTLRIDDGNLKKSSNMTLADAVAILKSCGAKEKKFILHTIQQLSVADGDIDPNESLLIAALILAIEIELPEKQKFTADLVSIPTLRFDIRNTVIYVESSYNDKTNQAITREYEDICQLLEQREKQLFYLPFAMKALNIKKLTFRQMIMYLEPLISPEQLLMIEHDMKNFDTVSLSKEIFLNNLDSRGFNLKQPAFLFKIDNLKASTYQDFLVLSIKKDPLETLQQFYALNDNLLQLPEKTHIVDELEYTGVHKIIIDTILKYHSHKGLSRILISENGHFYLLDKNRAEVKIQALGRALYILYLRHEEGIALSELSDYRKELLGIYAMISNYSNTEKLSQTVDNLVDCVGNTINPLLSRIKKAFTTLLGEQAKDYLIEGDISEKKKVNVPRHLVIDKLH